MGMAASQVRFLSLQNRKNTIGLNLMTLSNRKTSLSRDMNRVAQKYNDAMNQKLLKWSNDSGSTYQNLNYDLLMKQNVNNGSLPYIVSTADGKVVVDDKKLTDSDGNALNYSYKDLATMISEYSGTSKSASGLSSANYSFTDNVSTDRTKGNASKTGYEYVVSSTSDGYSYSNSLRYDLFQKLGIIGSKEVQSFASINDSIYGNEIGHNMNNYSGLLDQYINAGLTNTASTKSISLSKTDGSGMTNVDSSVYFGTWNDSTSKIEGGSKLGNLTLAQHDLQEYKDWCNQPHMVNLDDVTTFNFTALSGHQLTQTTNSILSSLDTAATTDSDAKLSTAVSGYGTHYNNNAFQTWSSLYDSTYAGVQVDTNSNNFKTMLEKLGSSLSSAFTGAASTEASDSKTGWSIANSDSTDQVTIDTDTLSTTITSGHTTSTTDLATAANKWALKQTYAFYENTFGNQNSEGRDKHPFEHATEAGADYNGISYTKKKKSFMGIISWSGSKSYSFNTKDFMKTYFTYYQMYMNVKGDVSKLNATTGTSIVQDDSMATNMQSLDSKTNLLSKEVDTWTDSSTGTTYYVKQWNAAKTAPIDKTVGSGVYAVRNTDGGSHPELTRYYVNSQDGSVVQSNQVWFSGDEDTAAGYNNLLKKYTDELGNTVTLNFNSDGSINTSTYENSAGLAYDQEQNGDVDRTSYTKITMSAQYDSNGDESDTYKYYTGTGGTVLANAPTKEVSKSGYSYGDLAVDNTGSKFTQAISVYLTPNSDNLTALQNAINAANTDLTDAEASRNKVFSSEESKKMDYYDALFKRISENGWVYDSKVNSSSTQTQSNANNYLNAMLENNMYYVTEVDENSSETGSYTYTNKLATNISKIFQVEDTSAENVAQSEYETEKTAISNKEEQVDLRMNQLETEQSAITTELDSIKKIINDNVSSTFKIFT